MSKTTFLGYVPSLKSKHEAKIVGHKAIQSKGGSIRYTLQGEYDGRKTLPKTVSKADFEGIYGFDAKAAEEAVYIKGKNSKEPKQDAMFYKVGQEDTDGFTPEKIVPIRTMNEHGTKKLVNAMKEADTVGSPSPASVEPPAPSETPFPQEPSNENFSADTELQCIAHIGDDGKVYHFEDSCPECGSIEGDDSVRRIPTMVSMIRNQREGHEIKEAFLGFGKDEEEEEEEPKTQEFTVIMQEGDKLELTDIEKDERADDEPKEEDNDSNDEKDAEYEAVSAKVTRPVKEEEEEEDEEGMSTLAKVGLGVGALAVGAAILGAEDEGESDYWAGENAHWRAETFEASRHHGGDKKKKLMKDNYENKWKKNLNDRFNKKTIADENLRDFKRHGQAETFDSEMRYFPKNILYDDIEYKLVHVDDDAIEYDEQGEPMGTYIPNDADENLDEQVINLDLYDAKYHMMLWVNKTDEYGAETFEARTTRKSIHNPITDESQYDNPTGKMLITPDGKAFSGRYERDKRKRKGHKRVSNPKKMDWDNTELGQNFIQTKQREKEDLRNIKRHGKAENFSAEGHAKCRICDEPRPPHETLLIDPRCEGCGATWSPEDWNAEGSAKCIYCGEQRPLHENFLCDPCYTRTYEANTVGNPSPSGPSSIPEPAEATGSEPSNSNFSAEGDGLKAFAKKIENEKKKLVKKAKRSGLYENFGQKEVHKLEDSISDLDYYEQQKYQEMIRDFDNWADSIDLRGLERYAESFNVDVEVKEAESKNLKMALGITALGIGLAAILGKDKLSKLFDRFNL